MVSHKHKCIFIHIPKTGGETINTLFGDADPLIPKHANARQIRAYLGEKIWNSYFKFTIIRNPWDQAISMYAHLRKPLYQKENILNKYGKTLLNPEKACLLACEVSFNKYCIEIYEKKQIQIESQKKIWPVEHFSSYLDWITDKKGNVIIDHIGKFENLENEICLLNERFFQKTQLLKTSNRSEHKHYSKYMNDHSKAILQQHYLKEIKAYGYQFEDKKNFFDNLVLKIKLI